MKKQKQEKTNTAGDQKKGKKRKAGAFVYVVFAVAIVLFLGHGLLSEELEVTFYHLSSPKIAGAENIRLIVLSDLHNRKFGEGNVELINHIAALKPDLIIIVGDMVNADDGEIDDILTLCRSLLEIAPIYYGLGNHECNLIYEKESPLQTLLGTDGVHVLVNRSEEIILHGTPVLVGGLATTPENFDRYGAAFCEEYEKSTSFKLMLSHYPSLYYEKLANAEIDLGIGGHYHGGQVRLPFVGGIYHGDTGFFPKYSGGMYRLRYGALFVSRGMGGHNGFPRINNRPELAVIDINSRSEIEIP